MQLASKAVPRFDGTSLSMLDSVMEASSMPLAVYVERKFIPNHVSLKGPAGRTHYRAILKHVLTPERVDRLFTPYVGIKKARLRTVPGWPYLDHVMLCELNSDHVRQLTSSASAYGYSPQTVKHIRNVVSTIITHAKTKGMFVGDNPISGVELPAIVRKESHDLTIGQVKTILSQMQYPERYIALITVTTGMAASEICALQWKHVNLTTAKMLVDGQSIPPRSIIVKKQWGVGEVVNVNVNRVRTVAVAEPLIHALKRLRRDRRTGDPNCFVIATWEGRPISPVNLRMVRLKQIGRRLDMPWLSWQVLKRTHGALLSELRIKLSEDLVLSAL
jgi:integrase